MSQLSCPKCQEPAAFSKKRGCLWCAECEFGFDAPDTVDAAGHPPGADKSPVASSIKIFLSYGRDELADEVRALRDALRARGHEVWFDEEQLGTGLDWEQRIEQGLQWCDKVVLTMTPHSLRRPDGYCLNELAKAMEQQKLIIPVLLMEVPNGAPTSICRIQYLDWRSAMPAGQKAERFVQSMGRLCEAIEHDKLDFEGGQQRLQRYLQPLNYDGDIRGHVARFEGRHGLEQRLREWLTEPTAAQVLWLTGGPGLGKSAIAARLAHHWAETAAMHFCQAGNQDKADPARAILSIAYQLSQHLDLYRARLANLELEREAHKDARTLFDTLLVGPLARQYPTPPQPCVVILDGLDEATRADGSNPLAELVAADWGRLPRWLRLIVSSRPDAEVQQWLVGVQTLALSGQDDEQQADLSAYLDRQLQAMGRPVAQPVLQRILAASEGAFNYAVLLLEEIRQGRCNPEDPVDLPAGMNQIYLQSFRRRFPDATQYRQLCQPLLALMLAAPEPVPLQVMASSLGIEAFDVRERLLMLGSMVSIERAEGVWGAQWDTARLAHASLRTWLAGLDERRMPLAQGFAVQPATKPLAAQVLALWDEGQTTELHGFVARTLWELLQGAGDRQGMDRIAYDLSLYWENRKLNRAIAPGEHAAMAASRQAADQDDPERLKRAADCVNHFGDLLRATGQSNAALEYYRKARAFLERLATQDPDNASWQHGLGGSHNRIGDILKSQGNLAGALEEFQKAQANAERLAVHDPGNPLRQADLAVAYNRIGSVLESQGDLAGAMEAFQKAQVINERLATQDADNAGWQERLSRSHNAIGGILESQGNLDGAMEEFLKGQAIAQRLAADYPDDTKWQEGLSTSHSLIGNLLVYQGNTAEALDELRKALAIQKRLADQDPDNTNRQSNLATLHDNVGSTFMARGCQDSALEMIRNGLAIAHALAAKDPDNAQWQWNLSVAYRSVGDVLASQGNLAEALEQFQKSLTVAEPVAKLGPANANWQRDLSISFNRVGCVQASQGDLPSALEAFQKSLTISESLAAQEPENLARQRDLSPCYDRIGDVLESQGNHEGALMQFRKSLLIDERLTALDPDNAEWQQDLSASYAHIGDMLESEGNLAGALEEFRKSLAIAERLAAQDPHNAGWQQKLSVSYNRIGGVLESQGNLAGALEEFRKDLAIAERLTAQAPDNAGWQSGLSVTYNRVGGVLESQGNLAGALEEFRKSLAIAERLAVLDPTNAGEQRELSARYNRVGGILECLGNLAGALEEFRKALAIRESLAAQDPDNAGWLRDRALSCCLVGHACSRLGNAEGAEASLRVAMEHFASVQSEEDAGSLVDLSLALALTADHEERAGRLEKAKVLDAELVNGPWQPHGITGAFQKKLMPVVIERLAKAFNAVDLPAKAEIAARVQDAVESAVAIDTAIWDALLSEALAASPPDQPAAVVLSATLERLRGAEETQH